MIHLVHLITIGLVWTTNFCYYACMIEGVIVSNNCAMPAPNIFVDDRARASISQEI